MPLLFVKIFGRLKEGEGEYRTAFSRPSRGGRVTYRNLEEVENEVTPRWLCAVRCIAVLLKVCLRVRSQYVYGQTDEESFLFLVC